MTESNLYYLLPCRARAVLPCRLPLAAGVLLLSACAQIEPMLPPRVMPAVSASPGAVVAGKDAGASSLRVNAAPTPPEAKQPAAEAPAATTGDASGDVLAAVNLQQVALPAFVQILYAEILKKNVNIHTSISARQDLVTFRTGGGQTAAQI